MQYIYFSWPVKYFIIPERLFQNDNHDSDVIIVHFSVSIIKLRMSTNLSQLFLSGGLPRLIKKMSFYILYSRDFK